MNLFEIDAQYRALIDQYTGEILDIDAFEAVSMARDKKIENYVAIIKELKAAEDTLEEEVKRLEARQRSMARNRTDLKERLETVLGGDGYKSDMVSISFRANPAHAEAKPGFVEWAKEHRDDLLRFREPEVDKKALLAALKAGEDIPYASLESGGKSMIIR